MTEYGKWLLTGCVLLLLLLTVIALWSVFFWLSLVLVCLGLVVLGFRVYGLVHFGITQVQLRNAAVAKARAEAEQQRALADQQRAQAAALWNQTKIIPQHAIGMMLDAPGQAALNQVWTWSQQTGTHKTEINLLDEPEVEGPVLPAALDFRALQREIGPNRFLLGAYLEPDTGKSVPLWAALDDIISLVAIGPQGVGKTTLARLLALQQVMYGGELHVVDYFNDVAAEMRAFFPHCYAEPGEIEAYAETVLFPEMERRAARYREGERQFPPLLLIVDEWRSLRPDCPVLAEALEHGFTDWRKLNFRMGLFSVQLERADLGVSKSAVSTVALFNANENLARTWGYGGKEMLEALRALRVAGRGYCVVSGQTLQRYAALIALCNISSAFFREVLLDCRRDIRERIRAGIVEADRESARHAWNSLFTKAAPAVEEPQLPPLPMKPSGSSSPSSPAHTRIESADVRAYLAQKKGKKKTSYTEKERQEVLRLHFEEGIPASRIAKTMGKDTNFYYEVRAILAEAAEAAEEEQEDER
ncbi:MAG TPA: hypothetical protein VFU69_09955 [Ktedonobacterales bacterium]|nr:hypothetical protein [Ktedonobacterales bacterium]